MKRFFYARLGSHTNKKGPRWDPKPLLTLNLIL